MLTALPLYIIAAGLPGFTVAVPVLQQPVSKVKAMQEEQRLQKPKNFLLTATAPAPPSQRHHGTVRCVVFDESSSTVLVGGDGDAPAGNQQLSGSSGTSASTGATLSLWRLEGRQLKLKGSWGKPRGTGLVAGMVGGALGAYAVPPRPWRSSLSPLGEHAALVTHAHR